MLQRRTGHTRTLKKRRTETTYKPDLLEPTFMCWKKKNVRVWRAIIACCSAMKCSRRSRAFGGDPSLGTEDLGEPEPILIWQPTATFSTTTRNQNDSHCPSLVVVRALTPSKNKRSSNVPAIIRNHNFKCSHSQKPREALLTYSFKIIQNQPRRLRLYWIELISIQSSLFNSFDNMPPALCGQ